MLPIFNIIFPIFSLILIGYGTRKIGVFNQSTTFELNRYVVWLALPAQLFQFTSAGNWTTDANQWNFVLTFSVATLLVFLLVMVIRWSQTKNISSASFDGLSASYANTGYMGIPLCVLALGDSSIAAPLIATLIVVCGLFSISVAFIEASINSEKRWFEIAVTILKALIKNPLIVAPLAGVLWSKTDLEIASPIQQIVTFLAASSTPCALISIGLFLANKSDDNSKNISLLVFAKLIIHPVLAWFIADSIFHLPSMWVKAAVLISALPTGTGPFMLAQYYHADGQVISRSVLVTTIGSIFTLSCLVWLISI